MMTMKKWISMAMVLCILATLTACGSSGTKVYVQSVSSLMNMGGIAPGDRFGGIVVSENVAEIQKDGDKSIAELLVREGDDVTEGQTLFSYDTDQLQLALDKQKLELEQLQASIDSYTEQIADLEKDRNRASANNKLQYTVQIQSLQVDLKEAQLNLAAKEKEVANSESVLENAVVTAPVTGRIQSISENGMDNYGNPLPYITIQQSGSYRVKGTIGELQFGSIMEGVRLKILSRTDSNACWYGTVALIDYENPSQGNDQNMYYGMGTDEMTSSTKYPFYVELESTEGLLLGQHVYMELDTGDGETAGISISSAFIDYDENGNSFVWAENRNKLEKRTVTLGEYNMMTDTFQILSGLTEDDYIAFPDYELCHEGAPTTHSEMKVESDDVIEDAVIEGDVFEGAVIEGAIFEGAVIAEGEVA